MGNIKIAKYSDDFYEYLESGKVIIYGAGTYGKVLYHDIGKVDYFCDKKALEIGTLFDVPVILPKQLSELDGTKIIVVCVKNESIRDEVISTIEQMDIDAVIFNPFDSISFDYFKGEKTSALCSMPGELKRVRIVNRSVGILEKFANKMQEELTKMGIQADIDECSDANADMNYYTHFSLPAFQQKENASFMITHVNCMNNINQIKHALKKSQMGICMSRETMEMLIMNGIEREKLCYINPAQDGVIKPRKYVLGVTHNCYDALDNRKRATAILDFTENLDTDYFHFKIMGEGWDAIIDKLRERGFTVDHYPKFELETYTELIPTLDYYLYWGFDEGSMGYLDALAAGVKTIVTPQGYHLDAKGGITYPCRTIADFEDALLSIENERKKIRSAVKDWTWDNFARKHVEVWNYMLGNQADCSGNRHKYEDGIFSVMTIDNK